MRLTASQRALVEQHLPLAFKLATVRARSTPRLFEATDDLKQAAAEGLCIASTRFDPKRGIQFSTFAWYWIKQAVEDTGRRYLNIATQPQSSRRPGTHNGFNLRSDQDIADVLPPLESCEAEVLGQQAWAVAEREIASRLEKRLRDPRRAATLFMKTEFGGELMREAGAPFGLSRQRVEQIVNKARPAFEAWCAEERHSAERQAA